MTEKPNTPQPFIPESLPLPDDYIKLTPHLLKLVSEAKENYGVYKGYLQNIPNPMLLVAPLVTQEAVLSSKLEGTHATIEDVLNYKAGIDTVAEPDEVKEVLNYRRALDYAMENLVLENEESKPGKIPLSSRIIKSMHKILLDNVRGETKNPGEYKRQQNFIGSKHEITFTPLPPDLTAGYMRNLEDYIHSEEIDLLIQAAIIHAQFEMIHPFEDGNGRIGRLLIPLFLYYKGSLLTPTFYMSSYFDADRSLYLQKLANVSQQSDWNGWIEYFLKGVILQSKANTNTATRIMRLFDGLERSCVKMLNSKFSHQIILYIFESPVFYAKELAAAVETTDVTINKLLDKMVSQKILDRYGKKSRIYVFSELISILNNS